MLLDSLIENLQAEGLLQAVPRTHVVVAYSGGADSTALLYLLHDLKERFPLDVTAAYYNHGWRGFPPEELPLVHKSCMACHTPLVVIQPDRTIPHTERAAREARYQQLTTLAYNLRADALLTAHHADDQIETLLFRILRGTGIDGLIGIQKRLVLGPDDGKPVPILRPLLDVPRHVLRAYIRERNLAYYDDPTNATLKHQRNVIRHQVLPVLEEAFPQVKNSLYRLSLVAEGDAHIIEDSIDALWANLYGEDEHGPYLNAIGFNQLGLPFQRRLIKRFFSRQGIFPDFQTIEDVLSFIRGEGRRQLSSGLKSVINTENGQKRFLSLYKDRLRLIEPAAETARMEPVSITVPGYTPVPALNATLTAVPWDEVQKAREQEADEESDEEAMPEPEELASESQVPVDLSAYLDKSLQLRTRQPGDKFHPIGMEVPLRFKKFLINRGVPRFERNRLPVLVHGDRILWAPGLGISQDVAVKPYGSPTHLLKLEPGLISPPAPAEPQPEPESPVAVQPEGVEHA